MGTALHAPQVIIDARMLYLVWLPADPDAAAKLVPEGLTPAEDRPVYLNPYLVPLRGGLPGAGHRSAAVHHPRRRRLRQRPLRLRRRPGRDVRGAVGRVPRPEPP